MLVRDHSRTLKRTGQLGLDTPAREMGEVAASVKVARLQIRDQAFMYLNKWVSCLCSRRSRSQSVPRGVFKCAPMNKRRRRKWVISPFIKTQGKQVQTLKVNS